MSKIEKIGKFYNKNYKSLLLIPAILLILSLALLGYKFSTTGDFFDKDISLTGGTSITIISKTQINLLDLENHLMANGENDFIVKELSDFRSGAQKAVVIESRNDAITLKPIIADFLGYELDNENSSIESTGSALGSSFYKQLRFAIVLSFSFMAIVVLFIFGYRWKFKLICILVTLIPVILFFSELISIDIATIANIIILIVIIPFYFKYSIPSAAVVISAFADIMMTLAFIDILGMKVSSAGITAILMLIGYSVDSDIMLTTRLLKRHGNTDKNLFEAFKTGITMTLTSIIAITTALIIVQSFSEILKQIFTILLIGLAFDIINTWITNASILKWYIDSGDKKE